MLQLAPEDSVAMDAVDIQHPRGQGITSRDLSAQRERCVSDCYQGLVWQIEVSMPHVIAEDDSGDFVVAAINNRPAGATPKTKDRLGQAARASLTPVNLFPDPSVGLERDVEDPLYSPPAPPMYTPSSPSYTPSSPIADGQYL